MKGSSDSYTEAHESAEARGETPHTRLREVGRR